MKETIRLKNVKKIYKMDGASCAALNGVSLSVEQGDFLIVMGRSGSGKSTLLHIMGCLDSPTEGEVWIDGIKTSEMSEDQLAEVRRKKIGFVFQAFNLIPTLDVLRNVTLPMMFEGLGKKEREERAKKLLESVGLGAKLGNYPNQLSGGEKQRVAIARALANDPEIVVADEPTGNLDSASAKQILEIFDYLQREELKTVIVVTHEQYVADLAEKIVYMKDGKISEDGKVRGKTK